MAQNEFYGILNALARIRRATIRTLEENIPTKRAYKRTAIFAALALTALLAVALWPVSVALAEPVNDASSETTAKSTNDTTAETLVKPTDNTEDLEITSLGELAGKKLGMLSGSHFDQLLIDTVEGISQGDIYYFNNNSEIVGALKNEKIDAMITDSPIALLAVNKNEGIGIIPEYVVEDHYGFVLEKDDPLTPKINERLKVYRDDGTIERLKEKWANPDDSVKTMPEQDWDAPNGTLVVATSIDNEPINYLANNKLHGMCIELVEMIARDLGYGVEYRTTGPAALMAEVQSGKADIVAESLSITEERKKMVDMTEPYYDGGVTVVVRTTKEDAAKQGFLEGLAASFERTFIVEDRWKLVLDGLGVTLLVSVVSGAAGLALGFLFVLLRRRRPGGLADRLIGVLESLAGGLPVVVVLMLFYYVVFGSASISGAVVAIVAFTLLFGASTGSTMWNAIRAVDAGQTEAGRALGFSDNKTFFLVVLPQAARRFAPTLISQFVGLIKDTAVVGYITVQDLTRVGDLIRARTMEAFFPLVATAIIYFLFCWLMGRILGRLAKKLEPKDGPRTIKGVDLE